MREEPAVSAPTGRRRSREDGNTLLLFPAGLLVMLVLAAIAVDAAATFSAHRTVAGLAAGLANDAASAVAEDRFYDGGVVRIDPDRATARVAARLAADGDATRLSVRCPVDVAAAGDRVTVTCYGDAPQVVSPLRLFGVVTRDVAATATAVPDQP